jgi:hypothetical protein
MAPPQLSGQYAQSVKAIVRVNIEFAKDTGVLMCMC